MRCFHGASDWWTWPSGSPGCSTNRGENDAALRPVLLEGLDAVVPDLRIERLAGASHWLVHEQPRAIAASIHRFVGGNASDGA